MSRAYKISVSDSQQRVVRAADRVSTHLELIEVLPCQEMAALLADELEKQGFERKNDRLVRQAKDLTITVDPDTGEVSVSSETTKQVQLATTREDHAYDEVGPNAQRVQESLKKEVKQELKRQASEQTSALQTEVTDRLERHLGDVRQELDRVVNRVTAAALKRKAAQLGQIKEMTEDRENGSLTIVVEV